MAVVRREIRIARPPDQVWRLAGDPAALYTWFPGMVSSEVDGSTRVITTRTGLAMPEQIVTNDPVRRLFQYRITAPLVSNHLGTLSVESAPDGGSLVRYETECEPDMLALVIGGASGDALRELRRQMETQPNVAEA